MGLDGKVSEKINLSGYVLTIVYDWLERNTDGVLGTIRILEELPFIEKVNYNTKNELIIYTNASKGVDEIRAVIDGIFTGTWANSQDAERVMLDLEESRNNALTVEDIQDIVSAIRHWFDDDANADILPIFINHHLDNVDFAQIPVQTKEQYHQQYEVMERLFRKRGKPERDFDKAYQEYVEHMENSNRKCRLNAEQSQRWWTFYTEQLGNPMMRRGNGWHYARYIARMQLAGRY